MFKILVALNTVLNLRFKVNENMRDHVTSLESQLAGMVTMRSVIEESIKVANLYHML